MRPRARRRHRPAAVVASAGVGGSERDAKSDKGAELGMIRIKKVEEVRSELASPLWENEEGQLPEERRKA